ncbi:hypothetical protein, partial [Aestuariicoccus sp. MJ-SS9]|uniref:hypothetical protein n=1 Tax=Aestuariicoccus sp. MJ-SS9 TaxID=3079855 RepID=UPI00291284C0
MAHFESFGGFSALRFGPTRGLNIKGNGSDDSIEGSPENDLIQSGLNNAFRRTEGGDFVWWACAGRRT